MDLIFLKNNINIQKYLVSRYICKCILYLVSGYFFAESIVSVSRYLFKSILQYSAVDAGERGDPSAFVDGDAKGKTSSQSAVC